MHTRRVRVPPLQDATPLSLAEAHLAAAHVQARAINYFTFVLALGGLVVLLVILHESHAWRNTALGIVQDAIVSESKVRLSDCSKLRG